MCLEYPDYTTDLFEKKYKLYYQHSQRNQKATLSSEPPIKHAFCVRRSSYY